MFILVLIVVDSLARILHLSLVPCALWLLRSAWACVGVPNANADGVWYKAQGNREHAAKKGECKGAGSAGPVELFCGTSLGRGDGYGDGEASCHRN